jgi:hypothetical protein
MHLCLDFSSSTLSGSLSKGHGCRRIRTLPTVPVESSGIDRILIFIDCRELRWLHVKLLAILCWAMSLWIVLLVVVVFVVVHRCDVATHQQEMALPKAVQGVLWSWCSEFRVICVGLTKRLDIGTGHYSDDSTNNSTPARVRTKEGTHVSWADVVKGTMS